MQEAQVEEVSGSTLLLPEFIFKIGLASRSGKALQSAKHFA
jgi:hypothetical protein